jgi:hypothetical protein
MAREGGAGPTDEAARDAAGEAEGIVASMRRLGGHVVTIGEALARTDSPYLEDEAERLRTMAERSPGDVSAQRSADAVTDRLAVRDRLRLALAELEGKLQSSALGLEGLVARVAEVRAAAASVGDVDLSAENLHELTTEVEGLRQGLAAAERVATRALAGPS